MAPTAAPAPEMPAPEGAPTGMAEGGLAMLPVADDMFDEPTNGGYDDGYAGGGIVAFAGGGSNLYRQPDDVESFRDWAGRILQRETGKKYGAVNREGSGAMGIGQVMPDTGKALAKIAGLPWRPDLMRGTNTEAKQYQNTITGLALREAWNSQGGNPQNASGYYFAGPNRANWKGKTADYIAGTAGGMAPRGPVQAAAAAPEAAGGKDFKARTPDILASADEFRKALTENAPRESKRRDEMIAELEGSLSPEARKQERKSRMWEALAQFGFEMAQTPGSLLQAASAAASKALPTLRKGDDEAKAQLRADRSALVALEDKSNEERQQIESLALKMAMEKEGLLQKTESLELQYTLAKMDDATQRAIAAASRYVQLYSTAYGARMQSRSADKDRAANLQIAGIRAGAKDSFDPLDKTGAQAGNTVDAGSWDD